MGSIPTVEIQKGKESCRINELDLDAWREKGWRVEGEAEAPQPKPEARPEIGKPAKRKE